MYLALHTSDPGNSPDGTTEVSDANYARINVSEADWTETGDGPTTLTNDIEYQFDPFDSAVGDITHATFVGSASGSEFNVVGAVDPVRNFQSGEFAAFQAGEITFEID